MHHSLDENLTDIATRVASLAREIKPDRIDARIDLGGDRRTSAGNMNRGFQAGLT
jgi:hypothetical protein